MAEQSEALVPEPWTPERIETEIGEARKIIVEAETTIRLLDLKRGEA
ncbi:hypothetical protein [Rhodococcoides fascians]|nr:hypothetical protein [Rhodococcus fascians]